MRDDEALRRDFGLSEDVLHCARLLGVSEVLQEERPKPGTRWSTPFWDFAAIFNEITESGLFDIVPMLPAPGWYFAVKTAVARNALEIGGQMMRKARRLEVELQATKSEIQNLKVDIRRAERELQHANKAAALAVP